ncbi:MAG: hypothetical protein ACXWC6_14095 [Ramlibacter sp.]
MTEFERWRNARQEVDHLLQQLTPEQRAEPAPAVERPAGQFSAQLAESRRKVRAACAAALRRLRPPRP